MKLLEATFGLALIAAVVIGWAGFLIVMALGALVAVADRIA